MPAKDIFHDTVKNALIKEEWTITNDSLFVQFGDVDMYVDIGAEKIIAAEKEGEQIAVEVKSFLDTSLVSAFQMAMGQFISYRHALKEIESKRILYLAVPVGVYGAFFQRRFVQSVIDSYQLKLVVYDHDKEEIVQWQR